MWHRTLVRRYASVFVDTILIILFFLMLVGISNVLVRIVPLPLPLLQIAIGAGIAAIPQFHIHIALEPEIFLFLFIPPLLFSDGWRIPKREFFHNRRAILMLAFGLVFFTVVGAGYFVHWLIPAISLPAAFALAAVLSPTDTVAVCVISGRTPMPPRLLSILSGESLLNDASGLVAFKFALAATLTGAFSLQSAAADFLYIALSGLVVGLLLTIIVDRIRHLLAVWRGPSPAAYLILTFLLPFIAYVIAEKIGGSGILAAVGAGIAINFTSFSKDSSLEMRIQNATFWNVIEMAFNGSIFILLGLQLPDILRKAPMDAQQAGVSSLWILSVYVIAITAVLFALRFLWVWVSLKLTFLGSVIKRRVHRHNENPDLPFANPPGPLTRTKLISVVALAGVRGAVTLAGILSLPLVLPNGDPFPGRDLLIFLASGVILVSLLSGSFGLPLLLRNFHMPTEPAGVQEERATRRLLAEAAIKALNDAVEIEEKTDDISAMLKKDICDHMCQLYRQKIGMVSEDESVKTPARNAHSAEIKLHLMAIRSERNELFRLYESHTINNSTLDLLLNELDMTEAALLGRNVTQIE